MQMKNHMMTAAGVFLCAAGTTFAGGSDYDNDAQCPIQAPGADVTLCEVYGTYQDSRVNSEGKRGLSVGTTSWNVGSENLLWLQSPNELHPYITANLYRLKNDRFEQIGQMWCKHGFFALDDTQCVDDRVNGTGGCIATGGSSLGIACTDTYSPGLNSNRGGLGPRFEINPWTGLYDDSTSMLNFGGPSNSGTARHLTVWDEDLEVNYQGGQYISDTRFFIEAMYVTSDDTCVYNSGSHKELLVTGFNGTTWSFAEATSRFTPPSQSFAIFSKWPGATITEIAEEMPVVRGESPDGRAIVAAKVNDLGGGLYQYNYAVFNLDMARAIRQFKVPVPAGANVTDMSFQAVRHHDEPYAYKYGSNLQLNGTAVDNDPWSMNVLDGEVVFSTGLDIIGGAAANPIRWGTMYNFSFTTDVAPVTGDFSVVPFRAGRNNEFFGQTIVPDMEVSMECVGDVDGNNAVDLADLNLVLANFGTGAGGDVTGDGNTDLADLNLILANFGNSCL